MATFRCKVIDNQKRWSYPTIEAVSRAEAIAELQRQGYVVASVCQQHSLFRFESSVKPSKVNRFFEMLSNQLDVGIPLLKSLQVIQENEEKPGARRVWEDIIQKISSGKSLSRTLAAYPKLFSPAEVCMIKAGEEGGFLPLALNRIVQLREWKQSISSRVWGAIAYPCVLLLAASVIVPAILVGIVPRFEPLYESLRQDNKMPWITLGLLNLSAFVTNYGMIFVGLLAVFVVAVWLLTSKASRHIWVESFSRRLPVVGTLINDWSLSQFFQSLGVLLDNRVGLLSALDISARASNSYFLEKLIDKTSDEVTRGKSITPPLSRAKEIDREIIAMLHVGEQSNTLPVVLNKIATQLEVRIRKKLELSIKLIEPILLVVLAGVIGSIVIALILPIFESSGLGT